MVQESIVFDLDLTVSPKAMSKVGEAMRVMTQTLTLIRRLGLPENVDQAIIKLQRLIMTLRLARTAMLALEAALVPKAGFLKIALAGVAVGGAAMEAGSFMMTMGA